MHILLDGQIGNQCADLRVLLQHARKRSREEATGDPRYARVFDQAAATRENEYASSPLRLSIVRRIDDAPLDVIAERRETAQNYREVAATLCARGIKEPVDVLEQDEARAIPLAQQGQKAVDLPPQNALIAYDALRLIERLRDGIVLTREATDDQIDARKADFPMGIFDPIEKSSDVLVPVPLAPEVRLVATRRELLRVRPWWLPLIAPDHLPFSSRLETEPESADAREQFRRREFRRAG
jgi:hypothetical protein